jgi:hypothetical protein
VLRPRVITMEKRPRSKSPQKLCYANHDRHIPGGTEITGDLLRVKDVKMGKYLSFQGAFAAFAA